MENIIETRYLDIFVFFYSKYSPTVSIHLLQRFNSDSNAFSSSFCGIASSARVVAVLMVEMSFKVECESHPRTNSRVPWGAVELCCFEKISWARMVKMLVRYWLLTNAYDFEEVPTFKQYVSKFHHNLTFSSQVTVVLVTLLL